MIKCFFSETFTSPSHHDRNGDHNFGGFDNFAANFFVLGFKNDNCKNIDGMDLTSQRW